MWGTRLFILFKSILLINCQKDLKPPASSSFTSNNSPEALPTPSELRYSPIKSQKGTYNPFEVYESLESIRSMYLFIITSNDYGDKKLLKDLDTALFMTAINT